MKYIILTFIFLFFSCREDAINGSSKEKISSQKREQSTNQLTPKAYRNKEPILIKIIVFKDSMRINDEIANLKILSTKLDDKFADIIPNQMKSNYLSVRLSNSKDAEYEFYLQIYNVIKNSFEDQWNQEAKKRYSKKFDELPKSERKSILLDIPYSVNEISLDELEHLLK